MVIQEIIKGSFEESLLTIERLTKVKIGPRQALYSLSKKPSRLIERSCFTALQKPWKLSVPARK
jgi:hypothetical protein